MSFNSPEPSNALFFDSQPSLSSHLLQLDPPSSRVLNNSWSHGSYTA